MIEATEIRNSIMFQVLLPDEKELQGEDNKSMKINQIMPGNIFITRNNTIIFVLPFYNLSWYKRKVQLSVLSKRMCYT